MLPAMTLAMQRTSRQSKAGIASKNRQHGAHAGIGPQGRAALPATGRHQSVPPQFASDRVASPRSAHLLDRLVHPASRFALQIGLSGEIGKDRRSTTGLLWRNSAKVAPRFVGVVPDLVVATARAAEVRQLMHHYAGHVIRVIGTAHLEADAKVHGVLPEFRALVVVVGAHLRQVAVGAADATPAAEEGVRIVLLADWLAVIGVWLEPRAENEPVLFDSDRPTSPSRGKSTLAPFTLHPLIRIPHWVTK